jgi:glyoxylase-like metal-dependent hydrolase (beta-lactamase superfamily II)
MAFRKEVVTRVTLAALAVAGLWIAWAQQQQPQPPITMEKVTDNLWVIMQHGGNVAVMPTSEGVILVDDKFAQDAPEIVAKVKSLTDKPIRYVLNTHQHGDHTGGNEALMAQNAQVLITKRARANMVEGKQPGLPQITFNDETQVFLGGKEVDAKYVGRGHTNGDAVVYFPSERVLHTGDLFVSSGAPFCDTANGGSIKDWDATIRKALELDFDTVIPGHGAVVKKADLQKWVNTLATIRGRVKTACTAGGSPEEITGRLDLKDLGMQTPGMLGRGMAGMCKELAQ